MGHRVVRQAVKVLAGLLALLFVPVAACVGMEATASHRAGRARDALRIGASCGEVVAIAERLADRASARDARAACAVPSADSVTLNFTTGLSLNYLVTVDLSPQGRVTAVSQVGAW